VEIVLYTFKSETLKVNMEFLRGCPLVLPLESEERIFRSLLSICQDHARTLVDILRKLMGMIKGIVDGEIEYVRSEMNEVEKLHEDSIRIKLNFMEELNKAGAILTSREDLFRLVSRASEIIDICEGVAVRLWEITEKKWKIEEEIGRDLIHLSEATFETVVKLRESVLSLSFNSSKALEITKMVDMCERDVDRLQRSIDLKIITSRMDLPVILLLRDIVQHFEQIADKAEDAADLVRILAI